VTTSLDILNNHEQAVLKQKNMTSTFGLLLINAGVHAIISIPFVSIRERSFNVAPVGLASPRSHFFTALSGVN